MIHQHEHPYLPSVFRSRQGDLQRPNPLRQLGNQNKKTVTACDKTDENQGK